MTTHIGVLGTGSISDTHARAARGIPGVRIAGVYGRDLARAQALASSAADGAAAPPAFDDVSAFLRHRPLDLVLIGSPAGLHVEHAVAAALTGLHVLVEKPLATTTADADRIVATADRAGVRLGVFFQERAAPAVQWLKRLLDAGGLGEPLLASAQVRWYRPPEYYGPPRFRGTWALEGGGVVMSQAIHTLDLLLWLVGDVQRVQARTRTALHAIAVEDTAVATLEFANGAVGTFEATTAAFPGSPRRIELSGTEGSILLEGDRVAAVRLRQAPAEPPPETADTRTVSAASPLISDPAGHRAVIEDFLRAIETGEPPLCDGVEGRRSVELVEAIYESARSGAAVTLEPRHI